MDNSPSNNTADFQDLQEAIDTASEGDTLLIKGSYIPYGRRMYIFNNENQAEGTLLNKRLVLIGEGAYEHPNGPGFDDRLRKTNINNLVFSSTEESSASGSVIIGVWASSLRYGLYNDDAQTIEDIDVRDSHVDAVHVGNEDQRIDGLMLTRSAFRTYTGSFADFAQNVSASNCFINISGPLTMMGGENLFVNNVFSLRPNGELVEYDQDGEGDPIYEKGWSAENVKIHNSILYLAGFQDAKNETRLAMFSSNSELKNSIVMGPFDSRDLLDTDNIDLTLSNLSIEQDPFIRIPEPEDFYSEVIRVTTATGNYRLKQSSVGKGAGTDETDIGIYGGNTPWIDGPVWRYSNQPSIPVIESLKLEKKTVKPGEGLKVRVRARAKGNQ
ncbi:MAG: hypothetical protein Roseis2KO_14070 [Roseivirga sp.]